MPRNSWPKSRIVSCAGAAAVIAQESNRWILDLAKGQPVTVPRNKTSRCGLPKLASRSRSHETVTAEQKSALLDDRRLTLLPEKPKRLRPGGSFSINER
jgi:hypothetical protein